MVFDHDGAEVGRHQLEHEQVLPQAGWVEHNPLEIWERTQTSSARPCAARTCRPSDLAALGITNQRETTVVWDRRTGRPYYNAIVWQDTRTDRIARALDASTAAATSSASSAGLPPGRLLLRRQDPVDPRERRRRRGPRRARRRAVRHHRHLAAVEPHRRHRRRRARHRRHQRQPHHADGPARPSTGTTSCSAFFGIPRAMLPADPPQLGPGRLRADPRRTARCGGEVPLAGDLGDQQAATVGQVCFAPGRGQEHLRHRQLHAAQHRQGDRPLASPGCSPPSPTSSATQPPSTRSRARSPSPARRCSGCATSSASSPAPRESREAGRQVEDTGGVYFVPAFSGLFAPYWRPDARGAIVGLTRFNTNAHLARATLEAICYQTRDVAEAMEQDSGGRARGAQGRRRRHRQRALHAAPGRHPRRARVAGPCRRDHRAGRRLRGRSGRRVLDRTDELRGNWNEASAGQPRGPSEQRARATRVDEGRGTHPGLGRRRLSRTGMTTEPPRRHRVQRTPPAVHASSAAARWPARSSTSSSSAAASSAPGRALDAATRGLSVRAGRGARLRRAAPRAARASSSTAGCATSSSSTSGSSREALQRARPAAEHASRRTWSARCRSSTRSSTAAGSASTSAPGVALYDALARPSGTAPGCRATGT